MDVRLIGSRTSRVGAAAVGATVELAGRPSGALSHIHAPPRRTTTARLPIRATSPGRTRRRMSVLDVAAVDEERDEWRLLLAITCRQWGRLVPLRGRVRDRTR